LFLEGPGIDIQHISVFIAGLEIAQGDGPVPAFGPAVRNVRFDNEGKFDDLVPAAVLVHQSRASAVAREHGDEDPGGVLLHARLHPRPAVLVHGGLPLGELADLHVVVGAEPGVPEEVGI
jgi:hypothetical protein